ncbi:hypothetical protein ACNKHO_14765 [Shigella flexneri]
MKSWNTLWPAARICCREIVGYGATSDGADMVARLAKALCAACRWQSRGVDTPIDYLNSHGTSTPVGDVKSWVRFRKCSATTAGNLRDESNDRPLFGAQAFRKPSTLC